MTNSTPQPDAVHNTTVHIEGMSCGACVSHVTTALKGLNGVVSVHVDLERQEAVINHLAAWTGEEAVVTALDGTGYPGRVIDTSTRAGRTRKALEVPRIGGCCCR